MKAIHKILFVIDSYKNPNAGTEGQLFKLIENIDRKQFEPSLLVLNPSDWIAKNNFPCPVETLGHSSIKSFKTWLALIKKAKEYKKSGVQLAHVYFNDASILCPPIFKLMGIKTIISRRDMGYWYTKLYKSVLPVTGKFTAGVVVNSKAVKDVTHKVEHIPLSKIHVIYNGFEQKDKQLESITELVDFKKESTLFVIVANIRPIKRMQDAIEALSRLAQYDAKLVIIGGGDNPSALKQLADSLNVEERVLFLGARSDIQACLKQVDIGLLCSESEGFSNSIVEYQFSNLPVICSNVGGNPEAITQGENGYLYNFGDIEELTKLMGGILDNPSKIKELGDKGFNNAIENYSISSMVNSHHELYTKLIKS